MGSLEIEGIAFPAALTPLASSKPLILGGAGSRGLEINGQFIKFTSIGIHMEEEVIKHLAPKYKGRTGHDLNEEEAFFEDLLKSPHEKYVRVFFLLPLTGPQYSEKVVEQVHNQKLYSNLQDGLIEQFIEVFKDKSFSPGSAVSFHVSMAGLKIGISKDSSTPESIAAIIPDRSFAEAVVATIICKGGVSPATKLSLAQRVSKWLHSIQPSSVLDQGLEVEGIAFPCKVKAPGSTRQLILGGAGVRGLEIKGNFIKFTSIGIYIEESIVDHLTPKYKGKDANLLYENEELFEDIIKSPCEKLAQVTLLLPLSGEQYSTKVLEHVESQGLYPNLEEKHKEKFLSLFKGKTFPPSSSIVLHASSAGLTVVFSKDASFVDEDAVGVVECHSLAEAVLASIICKDGVAPAAKLSLAERLSSLL